MIDNARPIPMLANDLVVNEDSCNLSCAYCLTGQSNLKEGHREQRIFKPPQRDRYDASTPLGRSLDTVMDRIDEAFRPPIIKITGGEIFLIAGILDFVAKASATHEVVIVQSNATLITDEHLARLKELGNVVLQISLDGHLFEANGLRMRARPQHDHLMERVGAIVESGLPVEIYAVLTEPSIPHVEAFAEWAMSFRNRPVLFPFPIRGPAAGGFAAHPDQLHHLRRLVERHASLAPVLPPLAYLTRLLSWYTEGRTFRCHLPRLALSSFSDGILTPCPNIWFNALGNVQDSERWADTAALVGRTPFYQLLLAERPRLPACKGCFTPWDTLSMYFDGIITLEELARAPSYAPQAVQSRLEEMKAGFLDSVQTVDRR